MESNSDCALPTDALAAVVVNHDQWLAAADQLAAHLRDDPAAFEAVEWLVVHNGPDPVGPLARGAWEGPAARALGRVSLIETENRGYGAAVNLAASRTSRPFILALNADILPRPGFLRGAILAAARLRREEGARRVGIVGFRLVNADDTPQGSVGPFPTLHRFLLGLLRPRSVRKYRRADDRGRRSVDWATGACLLIARDCWAAMGGFDERYFLYYEDVDLCRRARTAGWGVEYDPSAACRHLFPYHARRLTPQMAFVARRAILLYYWKHRPRWEFRVLSWIVRAECRLRRGNPSWRRIESMVGAFLADPARHVLGPGDVAALRPGAV